MRIKTEEWIENPKTKEKAYINLVISNADLVKTGLIGGGLILLGILHVVRNSIRIGGEAFSNGEYEVLRKLDLFN